MKLRPADPLTPVALAGLTAFVLLNLLLRTLLRLPGPVMTLLIASLCAGVLVLGFRLSHPHPPTGEQRRRLLLIYSAGISLLYLGLLAMVEMKEDTTLPALLIYLLHWLCYPLMAWWVLKRHR